MQTVTSTEQPAQTERDQDRQAETAAETQPIHQLWTLLFDVASDYGWQDPIFVVLRHPDEHPQDAALDLIRVQAAAGEWWGGRDADDVVYQVAMWEGDITHSLASTAVIIRD